MCGAFALATPSCLFGLKSTGLQAGTCRVGVLQPVDSWGITIPLCPRPASEVCGVG
jgi:hypothetical protein